MPITTVDYYCAIASYTVHKLASITVHDNVYYLFSLLPSEEAFLEAFVELFNAASIRCEYYNSKQLTAQLSACYFDTSMRNPIAGLTEFVGQLTLQSDRGTALKLLRNISQNILRFVTNYLLGYEEIRLAQLVYNLDTEPLLTIFASNRLTGFALSALHIADQISYSIPKMKVLEYSTSVILAENALEAAPISYNYVKYVPETIASIFDFLKHFRTLQGSYVVEFYQVKRLIHNYLAQHNFLALRSDLYREAQLVKHQAKSAFFDFYPSVFDANGLEYRHNNIYIFYDALFYPLLIRYFHYKQNTIPMTALNIPFKEVYQLAQEIQQDYAKALLNCYYFKDAFYKITNKSRYSNMALGVYALKQIRVDLSKCFSDFNIPQESAIFKSDSLLASLCSFSTFELFVKTLVRTVLHAAYLFNCHYVCPLDPQTKAGIKAYYQQLKTIVTFFQYYDAAILLQYHYRSRNAYVLAPRLSDFSRFKHNIVRMQAQSRLTLAKILMARRCAAISTIQVVCKAHAALCKMRLEASALYTIQLAVRVFSARILASKRRFAVLRLQNAAINLIIRRLSVISYKDTRCKYAASTIYRVCRNLCYRNLLLSLAHTHYQNMNARSDAAGKILKAAKSVLARQKAEKNRKSIYAARYLEAAARIQKFYRTKKLNYKLKVVFVHAQLYFEDAAINIQLNWKRIRNRSAVRDKIAATFETFRSAAIIIERYVRLRRVQNLASSLPHFGTEYLASGCAYTQRPRQNQRRYKTSLQQSFKNSYDAILSAPTPFLQQMNFERVYHAVELNSKLVAECATAEFVCAILASINQLPAEVKRAPRTNYCKFGIVLINLLNDLYDPEIDQETIKLYPLGVRKIYERKRLPVCKQSVYAVLDAGTLVCRDMRVGTCAKAFLSVLSRFYAFSADPRVVQIRSAWKSFCHGLGSRGIAKIRMLATEHCKGPIQYDASEEIDQGALETAE